MEVVDRFMMPLLVMTVMMMVMVVLIVKQQERFLCRDDYLALLRGPEFAYSDDEEEVACRFDMFSNYIFWNILFHIINFL